MSRAHQRKQRSVFDEALCVMCNQRPTPGIEQVNGSSTALMVGVVARHSILTFQREGLERAVEAARATVRVEVTKRYRPARVADRLSDDDQAAVVAAYKAGEGGAAIGRRFGISRNAVLNLTEAAGVPRKQRRMSEDEIREAVRLYEQGRSLARVGKELGFNDTTIWRQLRLSGVTIRDSHGR